MEEQIYRWRCPTSIGTCPPSPDFRNVFGLLTPLAENGTGSDAGAAEAPFAGRTIC